MSARNQAVPKVSCKTYRSYSAHFGTTVLLFLWTDGTDLDGRDGQDGHDGRDGRDGRGRAGRTGRTRTDGTDVDGRDGRGRTGRTWTDGTDGTGGRLSVIPKTKYMTLGPKFYTKLVSSITRRRKQVRRSYRCESSRFFNS